jgi:hypothetical protein
VLAAELLPADLLPSALRPSRHVAHHESEQAGRAQSRHDLLCGVVGGFVAAAATFPSAAAAARLARSLLSACSATSTVVPFRVKLSESW